MIRTVPAGDLGLDVLLAGGFRLVKRLEEKESATVVVSGGAGAGKTLVGLHAALALAQALGGDVVVGCIEILPSEYIAQMRSARPDVDENRIALLPKRAISASGPRVYCGLLTELDPEAPDLVASLEALGRDVTATGGKPVVFVVDSLSDGYGLGASFPRAGADAVIKLAAQDGYGLVLCEEAHGGGTSPWVFAADTVLEVGVESRERGRWIEVRKHRFGASVPGRHELDLDTGTHPNVFPEPHAWVARDIQDVLRRSGWERQARATLPALVWATTLAAHVRQQAPLEGAFTVILSSSFGVARSLAYGLRPAAGSGIDLVVEIDPLAVREIDPSVGAGQPGMNVWHLPMAQGAARALRTLVEKFGRSFDELSRRPIVQRVIVGDLQPVLAAPDALAWVETVRVFASLVIESQWGIPVIAYASGVQGPYEHASSILSAHADLTISARNGQYAEGKQRWRRSVQQIAWTQEVTGLSLSLDALPRPRGRRTDQ